MHWFYYTYALVSSLWMNRTFLIIYMYIEMYNKKLHNSIACSRYFKLYTIHQSDASDVNESIKCDILLKNIPCIILQIRATFVFLQPLHQMFQEYSYLLNRLFFAIKTKSAAKLIFINITIWCTGCSILVNIYKIKNKLMSEYLLSQVSNNTNLHTYNLRDNNKFKINIMSIKQKN